jgi:DNA-binding HxlR family transcriptional regulator
MEYSFLTCAIARSTRVLGDSWTLLIMRDMLCHKHSKFKDFKGSKEKIASNILTNRLKSLLEMGLIEKLDPEGTKKSTTYIATLKGMDSLPIICQMYLFSIDSIDESLLDDMQKNVKKQIKGNLALFQQTKISDYKSFVEELRENLRLSKLAQKK